MPEETEYKIKIAQIRDDKVNGSAVIARNAINLLIEASNSGNVELVCEIAEKLKSVKPSIAALYNLMQFAVDELKVNASSPTNSLKSILENVGKASEYCIREALAILFDSNKGYNVITCSYSSNVIEVIRRASSNGINVNAMALESSWRGYEYHKMLVDKLLGYGINAATINFANLDSFIADCDFALIGADILLPDGSAVNGLPSYRLANAIHDKLPLYIIGESFKAGLNIKIEDGFDYIPADLISRLISDELFFS